MKGWAYAAKAGLQLDDARAAWSASGRWRSDLGRHDGLGPGGDPCRRARLLAIRDAEQQHRRLVRYFRQRGFKAVRDVEAAAWDLPLRMVWGGAGALMCGDVEAVLERSRRGWHQSAA